MVALAVLVVTRAGALSSRRFLYFTVKEKILSSQDGVVFTDSTIRQLRVYVSV